MPASDPLTLLAMRIAAKGYLRMDKDWGDMKQMDTRLKRLKRGHTVNVGISPYWEGHAGQTIYARIKEDARRMLEFHTEASMIEEAEKIKSGVIKP